MLFPRHSYMYDKESSPLISLVMFSVVHSKTLLP